jgi:hypothetical protein
MHVAMLNTELAVERVPYLCAWYIMHEAW